MKMRLCEISPSQFPKTAGDARLCLQDKQSPEGVVWRKKEDIFLPDDPSLEWFPLLEGKQFLAVAHIREPEVYFGGTDERPFLTRMQPEILGSFLSGGEEGFFQSLKPESVLWFEKTCRLPAKRQGDIFAVPLPGFGQLVDLLYKVGDGIDELLKGCDDFLEPMQGFGQELMQKAREYIYATPTYGSSVVEIGPVVDFPVLGTRHRVDGERVVWPQDKPLVFTSSLKGVDHFQYTRPLIVGGDGCSLKAPDHTDLHLDSGWYLLEQAKGFFDPRKAD